MFILRTITGEGLEINQSLGDAYNYVRKENKQEFERCLERFDRLNEGIIYGFIGYNSGQQIRPIYETQDNFIMTESGKTFARLYK